MRTKWQQGIYIRTQRKVASLRRRGAINMDSPLLPQTEVDALSKYKRNKYYHMLDEWSKTRMSVLRSGEVMSTKAMKEVDRPFHERHARINAYANKIMASPFPKTRSIRELSKSQVLRNLNDFNLFSKPQSLAHAQYRREAGLRLQRFNERLAFDEIKQNLIAMANKMGSPALVDALSHTSRKRLEVLIFRSNIFEQLDLFYPQRAEGEDRKYSYIVNGWEALEEDLVGVISGR